VGSLRNTLVYTSDKGPEQLEAVNRLLGQKSILYHQLTAEETADREQTKRIIRSFQDGEIQVLTAKRVLDEGVNIPQICKAFILASTTVERQWIQRRGRLLRTCSAIGKTHSVIHDLLALPPGMEDGLDPDARALVRSELRRAQEFARLARNAGRADGPLAMIDKMVDAVYLDPET
jgi:superfamily II DNA or RNA helicase